MRKVYLIFYIILRVSETNCKYMEGELHTNDNWAFLARFCFLSEEGQYEYYIEYDDSQGEPNLLLYYDADDQWPAVYKTNKTCYQKESVLHAEQNQIINLTARFPYYKELSGCLQTPILPTTGSPHYTISVPTLPSKKRKILNVTEKISTSYDLSSTTNLYSTTTETAENVNYSTITETFFESFNYSTTEKDLKLDFEDVNSNKMDETSKSPVIKRAVLNSRRYDLKNKRIICRNARRFKSSRERWWFLAISNCNGTRGIHIKYKILMTNGPQGDYWHEHFSADEFYILPVLMAFTIAYSFLLLAIVICSIELKSRQLLHSTYKLFVFSVIIQFFGIVLSSMAYLKYAVNGVGAPKLKMTGAIFTGTSETCFLLLLLLLAKGYTITRGRLPLAASVKLTIFMCIYVVMYISLFIYEAKVFDPGEVLYLYESPAGYGVIILRIAGWCMFIYSTVFTLKHYPEKAHFYYPFNICGTLWYIAGPAFIISANTYIDKWVRESIVCAVLLFITFGGHLMFLILTMPSVANKNFPYHVRTTQIGVMEVTGSNLIEQFNHHVYEPTTNVDQTIIIPLSRRTEEIFGGVYNQVLQQSMRARSNNQANDDFQLNNELMMQNVLSWSTAKNYNPLDVPNFQKTHKSLSRTHSNDSDDSSRRGSTGPESLNNLTHEGTNSIRNGLNDYAKEVPVELFTISKMVVSVPNNEYNQ